MTGIPSECLIVPFDPSPGVPHLHIKALKSVSVMKLWSTDEQIRDEP
jgi:hypothetical protein